MPFVYRLQKILDFRIRKKEEQLLVVQKVQQELFYVEEKIRKNNEEIEITKQNKRTADFRMMESYDQYLHHLWDKGAALEQERLQAEERVREEMQKLVEAEQAVKVIEKHKEKTKELFQAEEKAAELKNLSELGVQRYFQQSRDNRIEEEEQELLKQFEDEQRK